MIKLNNKGMSTILFALVFMIVLATISVGFAFLVRNDQRQTLDNSLAFQAQYAAETGVNKARQEILDGPAIKQDTCKSYTIDSSAGVEVTCVKWDFAVGEIVKQSLGQSPYVVKIKPVADIARLSFVWSPLTGTLARYGSSATLPDINQNNHPILRANFVPQFGSGYDFSFNKQFYMVPVNGNPSSVGVTGTSDARTYGASCNDSTCAFKMNYVASAGSEALLSLIALGPEAGTLIITAEDSAGNAVGLEEAQVAVDSNAVAQDISQRVEARLPISKSPPWAPGFAVAAESVCKDIKIDGTNNLSISGDTTCVDELGNLP